MIYDAGTYIRTLINGVYKYTHLHPSDMCMKKADPKASVCISNVHGRLGQCVVGEANGIGAGNGVPWSEMVMNGESLTDILRRENDSLVRVLKDFGAEVLRPDVLSEKDLTDAYGSAGTASGLDQLFPRDNIAIVANDLIEFELNTPGRKTDILGLYRILQEKSRDDGVCWYSTPHCPLNSTPDDYPALDARDILQLDERMVIGLHTNGKGTNAEGFRWMRNTFAFHDVRAVELPDDIEFLGQVLSVPRPDLAVVCREVVGELPSYMKGWDIIEITKDEALSYLSDGLALDERTYVLGYSDMADPSRISSELSARGLDVIALDMTAHMEMGGSVGSAVLPLKRAVPQ